MPDVNVYTHGGGHSRNYDTVRYIADGPNLYAALCDGLNGMGAGDLASKFCTDELVPLLQKGASPEKAILCVQEMFREKQQNSMQLKKACTTACALNVNGNQCSWANIGDSRLYHFSEGRLMHRSIDDSAAYLDFLAGNVAYEDMRLHGNRSRLTACIGSEPEAQPHSDAFMLKSGDGLLICTDGFWQYVYETEMEIDLLKSQSAADWVRMMLTRLIHRSRLEGDNLTVLACIVTTWNGEGDGYGY